MKYFFISALWLFLIGCAEKKIDKEYSEVVVEKPEAPVEKVDPAISQPKKYPKSDFESPDGAQLLKLGDRYLREGNQDIAKGYWELALKHEEVAGDAHLKLAELYLNQPVKDKAKAVDHYKKAVDLLAEAGKKRTAAEFCFKLAKMYAEVQRARDFLAILQRATEIDPTYGPPYCLLAVNADLSDAKDQKSAVELCKVCMKYASEEYTKGCEDIIKRYGGSE